MKELGLGDLDISKVEEYWDRRPCNLRHSNKELGTIEYFNEVEARKYKVEPHIPEFADFVKYKNRKVLEVGCGIGTDAVNFVRNGAIYTGVDLSSETLDICKKRMEVFNLAARLQKADAEELSTHFDEDEFDLVYSFGVIHHSPNPGKIVEGVARVLKPGGEFKLMLYARNSWKTAMIEAGYDQPEAQAGCPVALCFSEQEVADLLGENFEITEIRQDHIFQYSVPEYKNHEYKLTPWFEQMPCEMRRALEKNFGWHMLITAVRK